MISICEECGQKHRVEPEAIKGASASFKCKSCGHLITIRKSGFEDSYRSSFDSIGSNVPEFKDEKVSIEAIKGGKPAISGLSIRFQITLIIALLVFFSLSAVGFMASYQSRQSLADKAQDHLRMMSDQKSKEYKAVFDRVQEDVQGQADYLKKLYEKEIIPSDTNILLLLPWDENKKQYGSDESKKNLQNEITIMKQFAAYVESSALKNPYADLAYAGTETNIAAFNKKDVVELFLRERPGWMPTIRPWYKTGKDAGKLTWTPIYIDATTNTLTTTCVAPVILKNGSTPAIVAIDVYLATLTNDILKLDIGYNSYAFLIGSDGKALVKPGMERAGLKWQETYKADNLLKTSNTSFNKVVEKMVKGGKGLESYFEGNEEKYIAYTFLPTMNASLGIVVSKSEVIKPAVKLQYLIIYIWIGVVIIAIIIGLFLGNYITKPINKLSMAADLISQGKMDLEVLEEDRKDEIGVLTKSFNRLVISLKFAMSR